MTNRAWLTAVLSIGVLLAACGEPSSQPAPTPTSAASATATPRQSSSSEQQPQKVGTFVRSGGLAGRTVRMTVMSDGTIELANGGGARGEATTVKVSPDDMKPLRDALSDPQWQEVAGSYGRQTPDAYSYRIDAGGKRVVTYDGADNPPALRNVLRAFNNLLAAAQK